MFQIFAEFALPLLVTNPSPSPHRFLYARDLRLVDYHTSAPLWPTPSSYISTLGDILFEEAFQVTPPVVPGIEPLVLLDLELIDDWQKMGIPPAEIQLLLDLLSLTSEYTFDCEVGFVGLAEKSPLASAVGPMVYYPFGVNATWEGDTRRIVPIITNKYASGPDKGRPLSKSETYALAALLVSINLNYGLGSGVIAWSEESTAEGQSAFLSWLSDFRLICQNIETQILSQPPADPT